MTNPKPWDAERIARVRAALALQTGHHNRGSSYRMLRNRWSDDMERDYDTPMSCTFRPDAMTPFDFDGSLTSLPAVLDKYGRLSVKNSDGTTTVLYGVQRWALVIDGEQNWEDVTG